MKNVLNFLLILLIISCNEDTKSENKLNLVDQSEEIQDILKFKEFETYQGDIKAPVHIVEYSSLTCPHCADFHNTIFKEIKKNYIDKNLVAYLVRLVPTDRQAFKGTLLVNCVPKMSYYRYLDHLYKNQDEWVPHKDFEAILEKMSKDLGLENYQECISNKEVENQVLRCRQECQTIKLEATPTFYINGKLYNSDYKYNSFKKEIDRIIQQN